MNRKSNVFILSVPMKTCDMEIRRSERDYSIVVESNFPIIMTPAMLPNKHDSRIIELVTYGLNIQVALLCRFNVCVFIKAWDCDK